jgi:crotonobetainyl-CoA:carnitine CoA-transferase CaiB-like acyl-CoA transferase
LGITLSLKTPTGKKIFKELVKWADILVEDNPPRMMKEMGLDYESLEEINPRLVMTSITPFGQSGPYRDYKAYHLNIIHGAGGGYLTPGGSPNLDREPLKGGGFLDDYSAGLSAALATLAALYYQEATGLGQHIDASKQESVMAYDRIEVDLYPSAGTIASRFRGRSTGSEIALCRDGYILPMAFLDHQWQGFKEFMGNPEWAQDEKFKDRFGRDRHAEDLNRHIGEWLINREKEEVYHGGQAKGVPVAIASTSAEVMNSEQYKARGFFVEIDHPRTGRVKYPTAPYQFSETPWSVGRPAPLLGQHNEEVYIKRLDYTKEDLVRMREAGII